MGHKILFVIDELEYTWFEFNKLVTNFWFIREFLKRNIEVQITTKDKLYVAEAKGVAITNKALLKDDGEIIYEKDEKSFFIEDFDTVFFRPDPPVDTNYINACNVFEFVDSTKVKLLNNPLVIRNFNEKTSVNFFPQFSPENIVTSSKKLIIDFLEKHEKIVIKPLNRCFGSGVFILKKGEENISSIIATATENGKTQVMVQNYLKGAKDGDKRVLLLGGEVLEESVRKLPAPNDFKFAEHSDRYFEKTALTDDEKIAAKAIAIKLNEIGLPIVGLDMIDGKVIEINVTSPCFFIKEINALYGISFEDKIMPKLLELANISCLELTDCNV